MAKPPTKPPHLRVVTDSDKRTASANGAKAPAKGGGGGKNAHQPTAQLRALVSVCKASGYTDEQVAETVGISVNTLKAHYRDELANGALKINAKIAANLAVIASSPTHPRAVTAAIYWTKARMGWADVQADDTDGDEEAVEFSICIGEKRGTA